MAGTLRRAAAFLALIFLCACESDGDSLSPVSAATVLGVQITSIKPFCHFVDNMAEADDPTEAGVYRVLVRAGILQAYIAPSLLGATRQRHYRLTSKGLALREDWHREEHGVYEIPIGRLALGRVTAVEMLAPRHAMITYTYALQLNAMGQLLGAAGEPHVNYYDRLVSRTRDIRSATRLTSVSAEVTLSDDGWKSETWVP